MKKTAANGKKRSPSTRSKASDGKAGAGKTGREDMIPAGTGQQANSFPIVGIGASAGGLEAFEHFFNNLPPDSGMGFVLIPHLDPSHKSMMPELLQRRSKMPVVQAEEGVEVEPNHVYIIPPNRDMSLLNGKLVLLEPTESRATRHPIDHFFRSLASDQGENAIAIILSGTGTEGTLGLKAVKGAGGLVIAQDPKEARYDGMPGSAVATGLVDFVLPAAKIPDVLLQYRRHALKPLMLPEEKPDGKVSDLLQRIFALIRTHTGHDFSLYKQSTILRRIERRMAIHQIADLAGYANYLRANTPEIDILFKELLIRVTNFFRDKEAFEVLKQKVLPLIAKNRSYEQPVRVWVPGCSTGEEAYSLAIILHEYARTMKNILKVQIFATDIDNSAVNIARAGVYPDNINVDVSPERLARYFVKQGSTYKIRDDIREMVVFSLQNLIKDPPFSKLDLISCRNMLIYLGPSLQKKVIPMFHYALNPDGVLFLGASENIGDAVDMFGAIDKKWKIFQARKVQTIAPEFLTLRRFEQFGGLKQAQGRTPLKEAGTMKISEFTEKLLLDRYAPASAIVNGKGDILYIHGRTGKYLEPASGEANMNILEMAREGLRPDLRSALRKAVSEEKDVRTKRLQVRSNGGLETIDLDVNYIRAPENLKGLIQVVFSHVEHHPEKEAAVKGRGRVEKKNEKLLSELEFDLKTTKEHLQTTIEELEASNEEFNATNEELQSSNEELQSTNEELETSREELQSVNEELMTVNAELQSKIDELTQANNEMENLISSTSIATIFLDTRFRIKSFTPEIVNIFSLIQSDIGRPISDIASKLEYPELASDVNEVIRTLTVKEKEVRHHAGHWYLTRVLPFRTSSNTINGVVITFVDITEQKAAERLQAALTYARGIIETVRDPLIVLDAGLKVVSANAAFYRTFHASPAETEGKLIYELANREWDLPELRELLEKVLPGNMQFEGFVMEHDFPGIGVKKMRLNGRRILQEGAKTETILLAIEDLTGR